MKSFMLDGKDIKYTLDDGSEGHIQGPDAVIDFIMTGFGPGPYQRLKHPGCIATERYLRAVWEGHGMIGFEMFISELRQELLNELGTGVRPQRAEECGANDCNSTQDVRRCWFDDGKVSIRIQACLPCRIRLQELDMLTVDRLEDRPLSINQAQRS